MRAFILGVLAAIVIAAGAWFVMEKSGFKETTAEETAAGSVRLD